MKKVSTQAVASRLNEEYGIDMNIWSVVENCGKALEKLGMIALEQVVGFYTVEDFIVKLPATAHNVRWAVYMTMPWTKTPVTIQDIYLPSQIIFKKEELESNIEEPTSEIKLNHIPHVKGQYIDFEWDCPYVKFNQTGFDSAIMYTQLSLDDNGYPNIPEEAMDACVQYCAFIWLKPRYMMGKVTENVVERVTEWKRRAFAQAESRRMFSELSQNGMNRLFDVMASMDRKAHDIDA